ncbi:MAG TPA: WYL domain-containing protein [Actinomycetota bacterium]|nr:WYL domain-containing protein [Actinomycetota bacterium]
MSGFGASRPATRLLAMLELLEARGLVSGAELAERLEVDPRTVRRYAVKLSELGIPVEAERGPYGGYRLRPGYKLPPLMLTDDEATAVVLGLIVSRQTGLWVEDTPIEEALTKILRVLPAELRERVGALEGSLGLTLRPREPHPPATDVVLTLAGAIRGRRRVRIRYATPGREEAERTVAPYGLVLHGGRWYLAGHDDRSGEVRTFRVDRVRAAELTRERAAVPEGFDAGEFVTRSIARVPWGFEFEVVFDMPLEEAQRRIPPLLGDPVEVEGGVLLRARADDPDAAARLLVWTGFPFRVRRPDELREAIRRLAERLDRAWRGRA